MSMPLYSPSEEYGVWKSNCTLLPLVPFTFKVPFTISLELFWKVMLVQDSIVKVTALLTITLPVTNISVSYTHLTLPTKA